MDEAEPYIVGTYTIFTQQIFYGSSDMFGIRFKPGGINAFIRLQVFEYTDEKILLPHDDSVFDNQFYQILTGMDNRHQQLRYIEGYLLKNSRVHNMVITTIPTS